MSFLLLAVACSLAIGMVFKAAARRGLDRMGLLTANYVTAAAFAGVEAMGAPLALGSGLVAALGVLTGALFIAGFHLLSRATAESGMGLALGVMRLSVVVPVAASWWGWHEVPTGLQQVGLVLAVAAFALLAWVPGAGARARRQGAVLGALFVVGGVVDVLLKLFQEAFSPTVPPPLYLAFVFATAALLGGAALARRHHRGGLFAGRIRDVVGWGVGLGLANYGSVVFLLAALTRLSGTVVFPLNNVAIVVGSTLLGVLVWGERPGRQAYLGLAVALVALVLLGATA